MANVSATKPKVMIIEIENTVLIQWYISSIYTIRALWFHAHDFYFSPSYQ